MKESCDDRLDGFVLDYSLQNPVPLTLIRLHRDNKAIHDIRRHSPYLWEVVDHTTLLAFRPCEVNTPIMTGHLVLFCVPCYFFQCQKQWKMILNSTGISTHHLVGFTSSCQSGGVWPTKTILQICSVSVVFNDLVQSKSTPPANSLK